ncbi:MAG UNVERIFIED_CONTAM: hypothetical protein LVR29_03695 [Microcystis novacekii LVE1205-3]|jgi:hypothetical protein
MPERAMHQRFGDLGMNNSVAGVDTLRHLFVLLIGLRNARKFRKTHCEGRDRSASNTTAETAEAGLFQTSYNARHAHTLLPQLFEQYLANSSGFIEIFEKGVTCPPQDWENYERGERERISTLVQNLSNFCHRICRYWLKKSTENIGQINHLEAEIRPEADALLQEVQKIVDQLNLCSLF